MVKNLMLLAALCWVGLAHSAPEVMKENLANVETYKVEKVAPKKDVERSLAGSKPKKGFSEEGKTEAKFDSDSEVRYWEYSE